MTFEESLQRLDEIIETLGGGRSTLEDSLALYEEREFSCFGHAKSALPMRIQNWRRFPICGRMDK